MEISLVGLLGNAQMVELFDAWASVNCWDAVFFFSFCEQYFTQAKGEEQRGTSRVI